MNMKRFTPYRARAAEEKKQRKKQRTWALLCGNHRAEDMFAPLQRCQSRFAPLRAPGSILTKVQLGHSFLTTEDS